MAAITDLDDLINRMTGGASGTPEQIFWFKDNRLYSNSQPFSTGASAPTSLWNYAGIPSHADLPGAVAAPTNATDGSLKQASPGGGRQKWLLNTIAGGTSAGTVVLYDRLLHISGLNGTLTTDQTVGGSITRYTGSESVGNQIWIEINTAVGVTATQITANYNNQNDDPKTTKAMPFGGGGYNEAQRIIPLSLADGDTGVRSVTSVKLAATTGTAGNFGVVIARPLAMISCYNQGLASMCDMITGLPSIREIKSDACLALMLWANAGSVGVVAAGSLSMIEA